MIGLAIITAALAIVLKQYNKEIAMLISLMGGLIILTMAVTQIAPVLSTIRGFITRTGIDNEYIQVVIKSLGLCYVTQLASDTCKDAGETAIAGKIELAGKICIIVIALPLFDNIVNIALELIAS